MKIQPYIHRCTIPSGPLEGNKAEHEVTPIEVELELSCDLCGEQLATADQIMLHIYMQLTT
jgi:hypothetical protein